MPRTILVGVDGVPEHRAALEWAAARAVREGARLELVFVIERAWSDSPEEPSAELVRAAELLLAAEQEAARARGADAETSYLYGHVGAELEAAAADADLLVVGSRSGSDTGRTFTGSLAVRVAAVAPCPVAVVPYGWSGEGEGEGVVVGVDGEPSAEAAVVFAAEEADALAQPLTIVCAGFTANPLLAGFVPEITLGDHRARIVEQAAETAREVRPALTVQTRVVEAPPSRGLVQAAEGARLLVVGSRNRHGARRLMLGSVSHDVLLNVRVPVVVAR